MSEVFYGRTRLRSPDGVPIGSAPRAMRRYLAFLVAVPLFFYLLPIALVRTQLYARVWPSHWGPVLDFTFTPSTPDANVVIFGDSSAFLGIDPRLVDQQMFDQKLNITTVVLPNTVGSLPVTGTKGLDFYLAHHAKPRLIAFYFTAWDMDYAAAPSTKMYEGEELLLRHGTRPQIAAFAAAQPEEILLYPLRSYVSFGPTLLKGLLRGENRARQTVEARGHMDDRESYPAMAAPCLLPAKDVREHSVVTVQRLAEQYRTRGYTVAVYLAPVPACENAAGVGSGTFPELASSPPELLPPSMFLNDGYNAHVEPAAVPETSRLFARWLAQQLAR